MVDTTVPGVSAEIVLPNVARPLGSAGRIAIVGKFERGTGNNPYYFSNPRDASNVLGTSTAYSGSNIINYVFKQDQLNNNYGATSIICVRAGTTATASLVLVDGTAANVLHLAAASGGTWANGASTGLKVSVAAGTLSGKRLTVKLNSVVVEDYDNCSNTDLYNKINAYSEYLVVTATSAELARTLATVTDVALAGGTETSSPSTSDLSTALATLLREDFDILLFTDAPDPTYLPTVETWLNSKLALDKPSWAMMALDPVVAATDTVSEVLAVVAAADTMLIEYINQTFVCGTDTLTAAESAARYAGFVAGMPEEESCTNKIINDITGLNKIFSDADIYNLTYGGVTVFTLKNRENSSYGVVSAVTSSLAVDDTGRKTPASEQHAKRTLLYVLNQLNLETWLGQTGISATVESVDGELSNRISQIVDSNVVDSSDDIVAVPTMDTTDSDVMNIDVSVRAKGILKHIHNRIQLATGGS